MKFTSLKEKVVIQTRAYVQDQLGGYQITWANQREIWAEVRPLKSQKSEQGPTSQLYKVRWRWGTQIPYLARLKWRETYLSFITKPQSDINRQWFSAVVRSEREESNG